MKFFIVDLTANWIPFNPATFPVHREIPSFSLVHGVSAFHVYTVTRTRRRHFIRPRETRRQKCRRAARQTYIPRSQVTVTAITATVPVTLILGRVGDRNDVLTSTAGVRPLTGGHGRVRGVTRSRAAKKISAPGRPPLRARTERQCRDAPTVRVCARTRAQSALFCRTLTVDQYDASIAVAVVVGTAVVPVCFVRCASVISRHGDRTVSRANGYVRTGA